METTTLFALSGAAGVFIGLGWLAAVLASRIWSWVWAWIDDGKASPESPLTTWVMERMGYTRDRCSNYYPWQKKSGDDYSSGTIAVFLPAACAFVAPTIVLVMILAYPVTIGAFTLYMMARLARFARRHKKLFDKHVADHNAHK